MLLFVYGIFLNPEIGKRYEMEYFEYATVPGYATRECLPGSRIVEAVEADGFDLTGLVVEVPEKRVWDLDGLEAGYKRIEVLTSAGVRVNMYVAPECAGQNLNGRCWRLVEGDTDRERRAAG